MPSVSSASPSPLSQADGGLRMPIVLVVLSSIQIGPLDWSSCETSTRTPVPPWPGSSVGNSGSSLGSGSCVGSAVGSEVAEVLTVTSVVTPVPGSMVTGVSPTGSYPSMVLVCRSVYEPDGTLKKPVRPLSGKSSSSSQDVLTLVPSYTISKQAPPTLLPSWSCRVTMRLPGSPSPPGSSVGTSVATGSSVGSSVGWGSSVGTSVGCGASVGSSVGNSGSSVGCGSSVG